MYVFHIAQVTFSSLFVRVQRVLAMDGLSHTLVFMDHLKGSHIPKSRQQLARLVEACYLLSKHGIAFLDMRFGNVMFPDNPEALDVKLIDVDMMLELKAGMTYPMGFHGHDVIHARHPEVQYTAPMKMEHDWYSVLEMVKLATQVRS